MPTQVPIRMAIYPASFGDALDLPQIHGYEISGGVTYTEPFPGGSVDRGAVIESHSDPRYRLDTTDLFTLFETVDILDGYCPEYAIFRAETRVPCGIFAADDSETHFTFSNPSYGFLFVERLSVTQDDPQGAVAQLQYVPFFDGENAPIVINNDQTIDDVAPAQFVSQYYLGKYMVNDVQISGLRSIDIATGINFSTVRADGDIYARTGSIVRRQPVVTLGWLSREAMRTTNPATTPGGFFNGGPPPGVITLHLYQGLPYGRRYALNSGKHITIRLTATNWEITRISGREERDVETMWELRPINGEMVVLIDQIVFDP